MAYLRSEFGRRYRVIDVYVSAQVCADHTEEDWLRDPCEMPVMARVTPIRGKEECSHNVLNVKNSSWTLR